jgi:hypothetical protein
VRGDARLRVDGEEDDVGPLDGLRDLELDALGERGEVVADLVESLALGDVDAEAAGVDELGGLDRSGLAGGRRWPSLGRE